jgi:hypothetical protein
LHLAQIEILLIALNGKETEIKIVGDIIPFFQTLSLIKILVLPCVVFGMIDNFSAPTKFHRMKINLLILFIAVSVHLHAQPTQGVVLDADTRYPIPDTERFCLYQQHNDWNK